MLVLLFLCFSVLPQQPAAPTVNEAVEEVQKLNRSGADTLDMARALIQLAVIDDPNAADAIVDLIPTLRGGSRTIAVRALEHCRDGTGVEQLHELMTESQFHLDRWTATSVLVKTPAGRDWLVDRYSQLYTLEVKVLLLESLTGGKAQERLLLNAYKDKTPAIQGAALHSAARLGLTQTRKTALQCLEDAAVDVRVGASFACGYWGGEKTIAQMAKLVSKTHIPSILAGIEHSLRLADDEDEIDALAKAMLKARKKEKQSFLAKALIVAGPRQPAIAGVAFAKMLRKSDPMLRSLALRGIEATAHEAALPAVIKLMKSRDPMIRSDAVLAIRAFPSFSDKHAEMVLKMCSDIDAGVRLAATSSLGVLPQDVAVQALGERLKDEAWSVQDVAVETLAGMKSLAATRLLAEHMKQAKGLVRELTYEHLKNLTGQDFGMTTSAWSRWMQELPEDYQLPTTEQAKQMLAELEARRADDDAKYGTAKYHELVIRSGGVVFIFDRSKSMGEDYTANAQVYLDYFAKELAETIDQLRGDHNFNIIFFSNQAEAWKPNLVQASRASKQEAIDFILKQRSDGSTNLFSAIQLAFQDQDVQQICIMTDGDPSGGLGMKAKIMDWVTEVNRTRRVRIHTIIAGNVHGDFLKELAQHNGGTSVDLRD